MTRWHKPLKPNNLLVSKVKSISYYSTWAQIQDPTTTTWAQIQDTNSLTLPQLPRSFAAPFRPPPRHDLGRPPAPVLSSPRSPSLFFFAPSRAPLRAPRNALRRPSPLALSSRALRRSFFLSTFRTLSHTFHTSPYLLSPLHRTYSPHFTVLTPHFPHFPLTLSSIPVLTPYPIPTRPRERPCGPEPPLPPR